MNIEQTGAPVIITDTPDQMPKQPELVWVVLHNDNTTGPEFVIRVLAECFGITEKTKAWDITMTAHNSGKANVVQMTRDLAESKVDKARQMITTAEPGRDFYTDACELTFTVE